jgi:hypothetical protein
MAAIAPRRTQGAKAYAFHMLQLHYVEGDFAGFSDDDHNLCGSQVPRHTVRRSIDS